MSGCSFVRKIYQRFSIFSRSSETSVLTESLLSPTIMSVCQILCVCVCVCVCVNIKVYPGVSLDSGLKCPRSILDCSLSV